MFIVEWYITLPLYLIKHTTHKTFQMDAIVLINPLYILSRTSFIYMLSFSF